MFLVMYHDAQVGRKHKTLDAAERAVAKTFANKLSGSGTHIVSIVDDTGSVLRVFYVQG